MIKKVVAGRNPSGWDALPGGGCAFPPASLPAATPAAAADTATALSLSTALPPTAQTTPRQPQHLPSPPRNHHALKMGLSKTWKPIYPNRRLPFKPGCNLPPCYDAGRKTGYPVLYLLHGQTMTRTSGLTLEQLKRLTA